MLGNDCGFDVYNPLDSLNWNQAVSAFPDATIFHHSAWARVLHNTYGLRPLYLGFRTTGNKPALLPLMESRSVLGKFRGIALPFTDECRWLRQPDSPTEPLFASLGQLARMRNWRSWEVRSGPPLVPAAKCSLRFWNHALKLDREPISTLERFDSSVRRAIRKAEQTTLTVEISTSSNAASEFYHLLCLTRRRHGLPPQPASFFKNIQQHILATGMGAIVLAKLNRSPVAGAVFVRAGKGAVFKFGASDEQFQQFRPNNLVMWRAIKWLTETGCSSLDFGRTSLANEGLRRYKLSWGTVESQVQYYKYDARDAVFVSVRDNSQGWYNTFFRMMPPAVARFVGKIAYRHMA